MRNLFICAKLLALVSGLGHEVVYNNTRISEKVQIQEIWFAASGAATVTVTVLIINAGTAAIGNRNIR